MNTKILLDLALILSLTKIFGLLTRKVHLPQVVGALLAGVILGPAVFNIITPDDTISTLAEFGVIILMFSVGLETDFRQLRNSLKPSLIVASLGIIFPLIGGAILSLCFNMDMMQSVFIGVIITATSVSITAEVLREMGKINSRAGSVIMGAAIIDDICGVIILSVIISMSETGISANVVGTTLIKIIAFFAITIIAGIIVYKIFEHLSDKSGIKRRLSIFALSYCFLLAYIAEQFGIADITGAYIAGLILCESKAEGYIGERSSVLSYLFFSPIFFVSVGLSATFTGVSKDTILFASLLFVVAILTKLVGCGLGAKLCKYTNEESLQIGVGMISRGEVAIIITTKGLDAGIVSENLFSPIIIVVLITTIIAPIFLKIVFKSNKNGKGKEENKSIESETTLA